MIPVQTQLLKPHRYLSWISVSVMLLYAYLLFSDDEPTTRKDYVALVAGALTAIALIIMQRTFVLIDNDGFTRKTFLKERFFTWDDIISANLVAKGHGHGLGVMWEFRTKENKTYKMETLGKGNMKLLAQALTIKCKPQYISDKVKKIADGKKVSLLLD